MRWAKFYAKLKHGEQVYGEGLPYTYHLAAVEHVLLEEYVHPDLELRQAAWLHDVVEDTDATIEEVKALFGEEVARLVYAVTNEAGKNRAERHLKTYPKIRAAGTRALALKLADRVANVEMGGKLLGMYRREQPHFKEQLYDNTLACLPLWDRLERALEEKP